jgi:uncharacterized glyoxalase superfamily protein PhnB
MSERQSGYVMPMISVQSVDDTRTFYVERLGFGHKMGVLGNDGKLDFCTVTRDGGNIMFTRATTPEVAPPRVELYFQVSEIDTYHQSVVDAGVPATQPEDMWWGDRVFIATDLNGYRLWFYETVGEVVPPPGAKIV